MKALLFLFVCLQALASPPDFKFDGGRNAVFVDFVKAQYQVNIEANGIFSNVQTKIEFDQAKKGSVLFNFRGDPKHLRLNGKPVEFEHITTPRKEAEYIALAKETLPGRHTLTMSTQLPTNLFAKPDVFFKMRDLWGQFLERFLPTNDEYDQYAIDMFVTLNLHDAKAYTIRSNAFVTRISDYQWKLKFPPYFNTSSVFFHAFKTSKYQHRHSAYVTSSGRLLPITFYGDKSQDLEVYEATTVAVLKELEADYGEFAHPHLIIYAQGNSGGMEYAGATDTSLVSLDHELFHSYFGRGALPANGNTGAVDEGLASWRDYGYFNVQEPNFKSSNIAGRSVYARNTDKRSYKLGRQFFAYLDQKLKDQGGLKPFLKHFFQKYKHRTYQVNDFQQELNQFTGKNFDQDFAKFLI